MTNTKETANLGKWGRLHYDYLYRNKWKVINAMRLKGTLQAYLEQFDTDTQGIITESTKKRLEELEAQKNDLYVKIAKEEQAKPMLAKEQIVFWLHKLRELNMNRLDHRRRLIDSFVNAIFLYDDRMVITFNFKDGAKEVTYKDLETSGLNGSDFTDFGAPETKRLLSTKAKDVF